MDFLFGQILFFFALGLVYILPGLSVVAFLERKRPVLSPLERIPIGGALSLVSVGFLMIGMDRIGIPLTALSITLGIAGLSLLFLIPARRAKKETAPKKPSHTVPRGFLVILFGILVLKSFYLVPTLIPASTDLGHHLYWIEMIARNHTLPIYEERDIVTRDDGTHEIRGPLPISDFIIGEHLTLSAVRMISGRDFTTPFSILSLFLVHVLTLIDAFVLARRLFDHLPYRDTVASWTLLLLGILYAFGPPQMKYVEGGVVGNTFGNLLIPTALFLAVVAIRKRRADWFAASLLLTFGLAYTHHLSMLLFAAILGTVGAIYVALERSRTKEALLPLIRSRETLFLMVGCLLFLGFVYVPSYLRNSAVETVVGAPDEAKAEHLGLPFDKFIQTTGEPRVALALVGLLLVFFLPSFRRNDTIAVLAGWTIPLIFLTLAPELARLDLPSGRIANYLETPVAILSGFAIASLVILFRKRVRAPRWVFVGLFFLLAVSIAYEGTIDNDAYLEGNDRRNVRALALFDAGRYLAGRIPSSYGIVHDHINVPGDSFLKDFLLRSYDFPFYRAHLFRYDRSDREEHCTLDLISAPGSREARVCADELGIRAYLVSDSDDGPQFVRSRSFDKVYADPFHAVFTSSNATYEE